MELAQYRAVLQRWWWLLPLGALLIGGGSYQATKNTTPAYQARTRLFVNQVQVPGLPSYGDVQTSERLTKTYSELIHTRPILDETINQLNASLTAESLDGNVKAETVPNTQLLQITVTDTDPNRAAAIANLLAQALIKHVQDLQMGNTQVARAQIDRNLDATQQRITDTSSRLNQITTATGGESNPAANAEAGRLQSQLAQDQDEYRKLLETRQVIILAQGQGASAVSVADPALVPASPVPAHTIQNIALGALLGLLLAAGVALLLNYFDDRVRDPEELRERFNVVPLATVPFVRDGVLQKKAKADSRYSESAETLRLLRTSLEFVTRSRSSQTICITSALPGEGKSTVAANLAVIEAQAGKRVILVDTNLRDPSLHRIFGLSNDEGLSTLLTQKDKSLEVVLQEGPYGVEILPGGPIPPNPAELFDSPRMAALVRELRGRADMIIFDTAPILPVTDTLLLQRYVDGNVVVKDVRRMGTKAFGQALAAIEHSSGKVLGVVLNKTKRRTGSYGYSPQPVASTGRDVA